MARKRSVPHELSVYLPGTKPSPPSELTPAQAVEWNRITDCVPAARLTPETHPLLVLLCRDICLGREMGEWLDRHPIASATGRLATQHRFILASYLALGKATASLMTKLRLTAQSRYLPAYGNTRAATVERNDAIASGRRPWILDRDDDDNDDEADEPKFS